MLYANNNTKQIFDLFADRKQLFHRCCARLSYRTLTDIRAELQRKLLPCASFNSSHLLDPAEWKSEPWLTLRDRGCRGDEDEASACLGLFIMEAALINPQRWSIARSTSTRGKEYTFHP